MLKSVRDMRSSKNVPEFFIPKGPYTPVKMATGKQELRRKAKLIKRITLALEWTYYAAVTAMCVSVMLHLTGFWLISYQ